VASTVARTVTVSLVALLGVVSPAGAVTVDSSGGTTYQGGVQGGSPAGSGSSPEAVDAPSSTPTRNPARTSNGGAGFHPGLSDRRPPVITRLEVTRGSERRGRPVRVKYLIRDRAAKVRVTVSFVRPGHGSVFRARLGWQRTARLHSYTWSAAEEDRLVPDGSYEIRVNARDPGGNHLARRTTVQRLLDTPPPPAAAVSGDHRFPVGGAYSFGGADARFGAGRPGHIHQGQDIVASAGTPVVAPATGVITWRAYQASGAGHYLVMHADGERYDYVFMHLQSGSMLVTKGQRVTAGQQLGRVGATGSADGPHLHFEIWDGPWYNGGHPVDPLPFLRAWAT
jgi:murein DD-endopeptidase MepM/ murein hydrolase activator NlpD